MAPRCLGYMRRESKGAVLQSQSTKNLALCCVATGKSTDTAVSTIVAGNTPLEELSDSFVDAWLKALNGKLGPLKNVMPDEGASWTSPVAKTNAEMKSQFVNFADFFSDPALTVFDRTIDTIKNQVILDYHLSFWYPLPWRPRIIVPGKVTLTANGDATHVTSVEEDWEVTISQIITKQAFPRLWDIWHIFSTPCPEYPPYKELGREGKVTFVELPSSIAVEATWTGPAKFPGPPLLAMPGFSLFGALRTSRPNRDPFQCTLPVESASDTFVNDDSEAMKRNTFTMHVPSQLHAQVAAYAKSGVRFPLQTPEQQRRSSEAQAGSLGEDKEEEDDLAYTSDAQVGISDEKLSNMENISIMKSVTGGKQRANYSTNKEAVEEFLLTEKIDYAYKIIPRRTMAQVRVKGEVTPEKVKVAVEEIKAAMKGKGSAIVKGHTLCMRKKGGNSGSGGPLVGFQMYNTKACFNKQGQPAMAIYEIQFDRRETNVQVELEVV